jgi:hypothetical protein
MAMAATAAAVIATTPVTDEVATGPTVVLPAPAAQATARLTSRPVQVVEAVTFTFTVQAVQGVGAEVEEAAGAAAGAEAFG